jgi:hypothetical protein
MNAHEPDEGPERDHWQEYKDDLAMGYIYEDGTQREQDPTDYLGDPDDAPAGDVD